VFLTIIFFIHLSQKVNRKVKYAVKITNFRENVKTKIFFSTLIMPGPVNVTKGVESPALRSSDSDYSSILVRAIFLIFIIEIVVNVKGKRKKTITPVKLL
jgi:hypothetical protein